MITVHWDKILWGYENILFVPNVSFTNLSFSSVILPQACIIFNMSLMGYINMFK